MTLVAAARAEAPAARSPSTEPIVIGVAAPLTGRHASAGRAIEAAVSLAVEDFVASGRMAGRSFEVQVADDGCEMASAETAAQKLVALKPALIIGHICDGVGIAASRFYASSGAIVISPGVRHPRFTDARPGQALLRLAGRDDAQGDVIGRYLAKTYSGGRIALVHDRTRYARGLVAGVRQALADAGERDLLLDTYAAGEKHYSALVQRLLAAAPAAIFVAGFPAEAAILLKALRDAGVRAALVGGDVLADSAFAEAAGAAANGVAVVLRPGAPASAAATALARRLAHRLAVPPSTLPREAFAAYAGVEIWAAAALAAGNVDASAVLPVLYRDAFATVLGERRFDRNGDASEPAFEIMRWQNGKLIVP